jgi:dienelactone hydrolase
MKRSKTSLWLRLPENHPDCTGNGVEGFGFGGMDIKYGGKVPGLKAVVPFTTVRSRTPEETAQINAPLLIHYAELTNESIPDGKVKSSVKRRK